MRLALPLLVSSLALALPACGGGGGAPGGLPTGSAQLKGNVVAVNGQSSNVSGVTVRSLSTGALDVSDANGTFDLGSVPTGTQVIEVQTPRGDDLEIEVEVEDDGEVRIRLSVDDDGVARVGEDHCDDDGGRVEARARLTAQEALLEGHVKVRKDADGDQGFDVEAEHLAVGRLVDVVVIDPATGNEETLARLTAVADDDGGEAELELRTSDGDRLPFNVTDVADLADMLVEVRDAGTGLAILSGEVPSIGALPTCNDDGSVDEDASDDDGGDDDSDGDGDDDSGDDRSGEARLANQGLVTGTAKVELRSRPERDEEKIEVEVDGTNAVGTLEVWLEDPANAGTLVKVGTLAPSDDGLEYERDTSDGETLPFGVAGAADLVGLAIEVRRASDGAVLFAGTTPPVRLD